MREWLKMLPQKGWFRVLLETSFLIFNLVFLLIAIKQVLWADPFDIISLPRNTLEKASPLPFQRLNVLCLGVDSVDGTHRTDTILLAGVDIPTRVIHMVSIPRDTHVVVEGKARKINEIMIRYGVENLRALIEDLMEVRINRFVRVDFQAFINIIDAIGGLDVTIEHPMNYDDNYANLHIHFPKGPTHLDGKKALEYVRYRHDANADLGRIKRQQGFLAAVLEKISTPAIMLKIPEILNEIFKNIQTDMSMKETLELLYFLKGKVFKIESESLPGEAKYIDKVAYFVAFKDQSLALGVKWFSTLSSLDLEATFTARITSESSELPLTKPVSSLIGSGPLAVHDSGPIATPTEGKVASPGMTPIASEAASATVGASKTSGFESVPSKDGQNPLRGQTKIVDPERNTKSSMDGKLLESGQATQGTLLNDASSQGVVASAPLASGPGAPVNPASGTPASGTSK